MFVGHVGSIEVRTVRPDEIVKPGDFFRSPTFGEWTELRADHERVGKPCGDARIERRKEES